MASVPSFDATQTDYEPEPWYKNHTLWIVGGIGLALVVFYYLYSQQSATGSGSTVTTSPTAPSGNSSNMLAALDQLSTTDNQILAALQSNSSTNQKSSTGGTTPPSNATAANLNASWKRYANWYLNTHPGSTAAEAHNAFNASLGHPSGLTGANAPAAMITSPTHSATTVPTISTHATAALGLNEAWKSYQSSYLRLHRGSTAAQAHTAFNTMMQNRAKKRSKA